MRDLYLINKVDTLHTLLNQSLNETGTTIGMNNSEIDNNKNKNNNSKYESSITIDITTTATATVTTELITTADLHNSLPDDVAMLQPRKLESIFFIFLLEIN